MVWSHYLQETNNNQVDSTEGYSSSDEERLPSRNRPMSYDEWITWYSNDLMNMWMGMRAYREDSGTSTYIMDQCEYDDFCRFCYEFSCQFPSAFPS